MEIRVRNTGTTMTWPEFRDFLLQQNPEQLITVAEQSEQWINDHGGDIVFEGAQATGGTVYQYSQRQGIELIGDRWYTKYVLGPIFTEYTDDQGVLHTVISQENQYKSLLDSRQAGIVRDKRNDLLKNSDWTQLKDIPDNISSSWAIYRQQLRDITNQENFPWQVVWPIKPE